MSALAVPFWKRAMGYIAGWTVYLALRMLFALPRPLLTGLLRLIAGTARLMHANSSTARSLDDIRSILIQGGESSAVLDRIVTASRPGDLAGIVRGAVIRALS